MNGFRTASDLTDYGNWIGKSAQDVLDAVNRFGMWKDIFSSGLPQSMEIHRVRNHFNVPPNTLAMLDPRQAKAALKLVTHYEGGRLRKFLNDPKDWKAATALTGFVFIDEKRRNWYHLDPAGAAFHVGDGSGDVPDQIRGVVFPGSMPLKLISPDGSTGGSHEVIVDRMYSACGPSMCRKAKGLNNGTFVELLMETIAGQPLKFTIDGNVATRGSYKCIAFPTHAA